MLVKEEKYILCYETRPTTTKPIFSSRVVHLPHPYAYKLSWLNCFQTETAKINCSEWLIVFLAIAAGSQ